MGVWRSASAVSGDAEAASARGTAGPLGGGSRRKLVSPRVRRPPPSRSHWGGGRRRRVVDPWPRPLDVEEVGGLKGRGGAGDLVTGPTLSLRCSDDRRPCHGREGAPAAAPSQPIPDAPCRQRRSTRHLIDGLVEGGSEGGKGKGQPPPHEISQCQGRRRGDDGSSSRVPALERAPAPRFWCNTVFSHMAVPYRVLRAQRARSTSEPMKRPPTLFTLPRLAGEGRDVCWLAWIALHNFARLASRKRDSSPCHRGGL